jgi:putative hemolysin
MDFGTKLVHDVMTRREDIFALKQGTPPRDLAMRIAASGYSRVPIFENDLDDMQGMVHVFDVLKAGGDRLPPVRPVATATDGQRCTELLVEMQRKRLHLAVVRDPEGRTVGLVTLEDLLEELVGDISDEHDEPEHAVQGSERA